MSVVSQVSSIPGKSTAETAVAPQHEVANSGGVENSHGAVSVPARDAFRAGVDETFLKRAIAWPTDPGEVGSYLASDSYELHFRRWVPRQQPIRGRVLCLHGIQSHSGWYGFTAAAMAQAGYEVCFLDRRGSGLNLLHRGHTPAAERLVTDVVQFLRQNHWTTTPATQSLHARTEPPIVLLGLSWGGRLAVPVLQRCADIVSSLVLLYPGIFSTVQPRWHQRFLLRRAINWGVTNKPVPIPLTDPALFTSDPHWQAFVRNDPLAMHTVTTSFLQAGVELAAECQRLRSSLPCPALLMLAGRDKIINNVATRKWFERAADPASTGSQLIEYASAAHTLEFEADRAGICDDLIRWLHRRCPEVV